MIKYFIYSREQMKLKRSIAKKMSQEYIPGYIFIGNSKKEFTDIVNDIDQPKFSDYIVIAAVDPSTVKYKLGSD